MNSPISKNVIRLMQSGVKIPNPASVEVGDDVIPENICGKHITIHAGCRIYGKSTLILDHATLGKEAPVTIDNCQIASHVQLRGGFFQQSVFLKKSSAGSGSHVREGTIFEEEANIAHTVGLKQSILFPFVTLGSLINFCDCFMAGGTSRRNHSEVGSSYIHFNFTPNQDKVTPSLIGNVPQGVMLDQPPIFLGGQGGLVGPCRLAFGTVIAAGTIFRKDELRPGRLIFEGAGKGGNLPFIPGVYRGLKRIIHNNIHYIANLIALYQWYRHVRMQFISADFPEPLYQGLLAKSRLAIDERIRRLEDLANRMPESILIQKSRLNKNADDRPLIRQAELYENMAHVKTTLGHCLASDAGRQHRDVFLEGLKKHLQAHEKDYIQTIYDLEPAIKQSGTQWLQQLVDTVLLDVLGIIPSFK